MISGKIIRHIHTNGILWQAYNKSLLAKLRKRTGYAFSNCKKALELHANDVDKAEAWLKEQAQALGWAKAQKVQDRTTRQGLIAAIREGQRAALIELNCETDFVARNKQFHDLAETVASAVMKHTTTLSNEGPVTRATLDSEALKALPATDGKSVSNHAALVIGNIGENISLRRAICFNVSPDVMLAVCTHPAPIDPKPILVGKYGSLVAYKSAENNQQFGMQLCQHIIGMNPTKIGDPNVDKPFTDQDEETALIYQEFLLDPSQLVQQVLANTQTEILEFIRFEVGDSALEQTRIDELETGG